MKTLLLTILLFSFGQAQAGFETGNVLLEECEARINNTSAALGNACVSYIIGIADANETFTLWKRMDQLFCFPSGVKYDQLVRVVVKSLKKKPENLHLTAGSLVTYALYHAFPCGGES